MDSRWHELRRQMVIEITEEEEMNRDALEVKRHAPGFSGMFALDDYGSGYSNEGSLLELAPRFIKVDLAIICGIDTDTDKHCRGCGECRRDAEGHRAGGGCPAGLLSGKARCHPGQDRPGGLAGHCRLPHRRRIKINRQYF